MTSPDPDGAASGVVREIADAIRPLHTEDAAGIAVTHPPRRGVGSTPDMGRVEVRVYVPPRHPRDADRAMGMLQGHGYSPRRFLRGGQSNICIVLEINLTGEDSRDELDRSACADGAEQDELA